VRTGFWIRVGYDTGVVHGVGYSGCCNKRGRHCFTGVEYSQWLVRRNSKEMSLLENRYSCIDWVQERMVEGAELLNIKVVFNLL
jgi:hypothetical protein